MDIAVTPASLGGSIAAIASKSDVHRLMICGLLSDAPVVIRGVSRCNDIDATALPLLALGSI